MGETVHSSSQLLPSEMRRFLLAVFLAAPGKIKAATVSEFNPEVNSVMPPPPKKEPEATCSGNSICAFLQANNYLDTGNTSEVCKDVTVKPGQYIVNPKCLCEHGLACPSVTKKGVTTTMLGANMELQQITCQQPMQPGRRFSDLYAAPQQLAKLYRKHFGLTHKRQWSQKRSNRPAMPIIWRK